MPLPESLNVVGVTGEPGCKLSSVHPAGLASSCFSNPHDSRNPWSFPLLVESREEARTFRYTQMNDFRLEIGSFSHCILEVVSGTNQADRWRMLLQASCLARLGNKLRSNDANDPVVIMAIYIDSNLQAHEYLVYQPDTGNKKVRSQTVPLHDDKSVFQVLYYETIFNITRPERAFEFIFRLYNFLSQALVNNRKLTISLFAELEKTKNAIPENHYPALTSGRKRKRGAGGGGADTPRRRPAPGPLEDRVVQASLKAAGYELLPTDGMLVPITQVSASYLLVKRSN